MPKELVVAGETLKGRAVKDLFCSAARGTLITHEESMPLLKGTADLHTKLSKIRAKWCRRFSQSLGRDYIATLSEGLNGAIKRQTYLKSKCSWWEHPFNSQLMHIKNVLLLPENFLTKELCHWQKDILVLIEKFQRISYVKKG